MRERTIKVKTEKLQALSAVYKSTKIAEILGISKQRWHNYKAGENDIPESMLESICQKFQLTRRDLVNE